MNEFLCCVKILVLCLIFSCQADGEFVTGSKQKRGGNMGLFPFPRVGRAGNEIAWANGYPDLKKMHELRTRQGLIPFPRVGRADPRQYELPRPAWLYRDDPLSQDYQKRNGNGANGGLWFGPRLGRLHKRSDGDAPWAFIALKDPTVALREADFTPRLGRESEEEDNEDTVVEEVLSSRRVDAKNSNLPQ